MDKKFIYLVAGGLGVVVVLIVILVVLSKGGNKPAPTATSTKAKNFTIWDYNNEKTAFDPIITTFQSQYGIKVDYETKSPSTYFNDTINAMAAGNGPDIWIIPNNMIAKYQDKLVEMPKGMIAQPNKMKNDIEAYDDLYPAVVGQDNIIGEKIYGMPIAMDTLGLYINWAILSKINQEYREAHRNQDTSAVSRLLETGPTNWDEFTQIVQLVTKRSGENFTIAGAALGTANNIEHAPDILSLLMLQDGTKMVSDDLTTAQFHTQQNLFSNVNYPGLQALKFYTSFADPKSVNYTWNGKMQDTIRAFANNQVAMMFGYSSDLARIQLINPQLKPGIINIPQIRETTHITNFAKYDTLVVTKSAADPKIAWNFILMATDVNMGANYQNVTGKKLAAKSRASQAMQTATTWYNPDPEQVGPIFRNIIQQANDGKDAQTALDGAAGQVTSLLQKLKASTQ